jgi:translation initiation factor 2A
MCENQLHPADALIITAFQTTWRPDTAEIPFPPEIPPAPQPSASVAQFGPKSTPTVTGKPAGAYRPPGARGTAAPDIFKRQEEGTAANAPAAATPRYVPGQRVPRPRTVPGAGSAAVDGTATPPNGKQNKKKKAGAAGSNANSPAPSVPSTPVQEVPPPVVESADNAEAEALQKKIRNLNKKVSAYIRKWAICTDAIIPSAAQSNSGSER